MQIKPEIKEKIVLALDVDDIEHAKELITELSDYVGIFKVGLQLFTGKGLEILKFMNERNIKFFFDIKLHDIPNTVAKASENVIRNGASFFNVHTTGGEEMMRAAQEAARKTALELGRENPIILGVTVLTSISTEILRNELKVPYNPDEYAISLALMAKKAGLEGDALEALEAPYKASQEYVAIVAFGLITVLLLAVAVVVAVLNLFVNIGFLRFIVLVAGILALVAGIIAVALTGDVIALSEDLGDIAEATVKPVIGAGAALLAVGGILGGIASVAGFFLGKKK